MMDVMTSHEELLSAVADAAARRESADAERTAAILAAYAAGVPVTHIASSAGLSRQYVHRIIAKA